MMDQLGFLPQQNQEMLQFILQHLRLLKKKVFIACALSVTGMILIQ